MTPAQWREHALVVNGRFLMQRMTGVQRFALEITRALADIRPVTVWVPPGRLETDDVGGAHIERVGRLHGHAWEQVDLPLLAAARGRPLLVNLTSTGPANYGHQIVTHHDIAYVRHPESFTWPFRSAYRALMPTLLRTSAAVMTVSQFSRHEIATHYGIPAQRIVVVPSAVGAAFASRGRRFAASAPYLLAVSSSSRQKNFSRLVEAFLQAQTTTIRQLLIAGGPGRVFAANDLSARDRVQRLGRVDDDELAALYRGAAAFAFPSLYEGFGIPPLEAQASGTPVIASRAAAIPEVLGDSALPFEPTDVRSITAAIERIDRDGALRDELVARGRVNAARFSWATSAGIVSRLVDQVRSGERARPERAAEPSEEVRAWSTSM